jgi:hypothetical protein
MAGPVRQLIDVEVLERYVQSHVPNIRPPLQLGQVS